MPVAPSGFVCLIRACIYLFLFFFSDGLNKVFKDGNTKFVITTPDLLRKITQATAGLPDIKVGMKN